MNDVDRSLWQTMAGPGSTTTAIATLEELEKRVVHLSLGDDRRSLRTTTSTFRKNKLANPRLEALRRFAVLYRLGDGAIDPLEESLMRSSGFSDLQIFAVKQMVMAHRPVPVENAHYRSIRSTVIILLLASGCGYIFLAEVSLALVLSKLRSSLP